MRSIVKSGEPQSLNSFRSTNPTNWDDIHSPANQHFYNDCLTQCISDQEGLCGYTEMVLNGSRHIDHYIRKGIDPTMTFEWTDMIAAIKDSRFGADYKDGIVKVSDYDFTQRQYRCLYNPVKDNLNGVFIFYSDGSIHPADNQDAKAENTIKVFNLNEQSLKERRSRVMTSVRTMKDGGLSRDEVFEYLKSEGFRSCLEYEIKQLF